MALEVLTVPLQKRETEGWKKLLQPTGVRDKHAKLPTSHFCADKIFLYIWMEKGPSIKIPKQHYIVVGKIKPIYFLTFQGVQLLMKLKDFFFPKQRPCFWLNSSFTVAKHISFKRHQPDLHRQERSTATIILLHQLTDLLLKVKNLQK